MFGIVFVCQSTANYMHMALSAYGFVCMWQMAACGFICMWLLLCLHVGLSACGYGFVCMLLCLHVAMALSAYGLLISALCFWLKLVFIICCKYNDSCLAPQIIFEKYAFDDCHCDPRPNWKLSNVLILLYIYYRYVCINSFIYVHKVIVKQR